jgi:hypothetical protein
MKLGADHPHTGPATFHFHSSVHGNSSPCSYWSRIITDVAAEIFFADLAQQVAVDALRLEHREPQRKAHAGT